MDDPDHGASSGQAQSAIDGVEQPGAERQAQAAAELRERQRQGPARLQQAQREQVELLAVDLDSVLPAEHQARLVWGYVERQDWSELESRIKALATALLHALAHNLRRMFVLAPQLLRTPAPSPCPSGHAA